MDFSVLQITRILAGWSDQGVPFLQREIKLSITTSSLFLTAVPEKIPLRSSHSAKSFPSRSLRSCLRPSIRDSIDSRFESLKF